MTSLTLSTSAFMHNGDIPKLYTCDGSDLSPPLTWSSIHTAAKCLALIVDDPDAPDPDAPKMTWVHWLLYNIPISVTGFSEGESGATLPPGVLEGLNDWKRPGYGGPCPPIGNHRYFFKLYALDILLPDMSIPVKSRIESAMNGHILDQAELVGMYRRR